MSVSINRFRSYVNIFRREGRISHAAEFFFLRHPVLDAQDYLWFIGESEREDYFKKFKCARRERRKEAIKEAAQGIHYKLNDVMSQIFTRPFVQGLELHLDEFYTLILLSEHEVDRLDVDSTPLKMRLTDQVSPRIHSFDYWKISRHNTISASLYADGIESMDQLLTAFLNYGLETNGGFENTAHKFMEEVIGLDENDSHIVTGKLMKYMLKIEEALFTGEEE